MINDISIDISRIHVYFLGGRVKGMGLCALHLKLTNMGVATNVGHTNFTFEVE